MPAAIAVFDFDGTLVKKDSFVPFVLASRGPAALVAALLKNFGKLVLFARGKIAGGILKEALFCSLYKSMPQDQFRRYGKEFARWINLNLRPDMQQKFNEHKNSGDRLWIASASLRDWIEPWALEQGFEKVIATEAEKVETCLTGAFLGANCIGEEKGRRILAQTEGVKVKILYTDSKKDEPARPACEHLFYVV